MILVPINPNVNQRQTDWICVCSHCQNERIVSYAQKWNIETKKSSDKCRSCRLQLGETKLNTSGLEKGRTFHPRKENTKYKSNDFLFYNTIFMDNNKKISVKEKQRAAKLGRTGESANAWAGGKTSERKLLMSRNDYKQLRKQIFYRDNFSCVKCKIRGVNLEMDHIKEWCNYPELRYEPSNLRTLCKPCHKQTDNFANKAKKKVEI